MPPGARYCGRPGPLGNPWAVGPELSAIAAVEHFEWWLRNGQAPRQIVGATLERRRRVREIIPTLTGLDLACWCPLDAPCHVDIILARANTLPREPWLITVGTMVSLIEVETITHAHQVAHDRWPGRPYSIRRPTPVEIQAFREDQDLTEQLSSARTLDQRRGLLLRPREGAPVVHEPPLFA